jgi:hypothetical protein
MTNVFGPYGGKRIEPRKTLTEVSFDIGEMMTKINMPEFLENIAQQD